MKKELSQLQRIIVSIMYIIAIITLYTILYGNIADFLHPGESTSLWFFSGILLVVMGTYVTEPFFTSPADSLSNSIALIIVLFATSNRKDLIGYIFLLSYAMFIFAICIFHIIFKDKNEKVKRVSYWILKYLGSSKVMFSSVYILSAFSYFKDNNYMLIAAILLWIFMVPIGLLERIIYGSKKLLGILKDNNTDTHIGVAIKNSEINIYTVSVEKTKTNEQRMMQSSDAFYAIKVDSEKYRIGIETQRRNLIDTIWIDIILLDNVDVNVSKLKEIGINLNYSEAIGSVHIVKKEFVKEEILNRIKQSTLYKQKESFVGFVLPDSNINIIRFNTCRHDEDRIVEGRIVKTIIRGEEVLYQVINGVTQLGNNRTDSNYGYMCGIARKLGSYDYDKDEMENVNWTPSLYEPVYLCEINSDTNLKEIAETSIGRLPKSDMKITIKDIDALVTHNTAILGILGVGKSCLTFELIKKMTDEDIKVICLDITDQYASDKGLYNYLPKDKIIAGGVNEDTLKELEIKAENTSGSSEKSTWGNVKDFSKLVEDIVKRFLKEVPEKKVLVINPDLFIVKKGPQDFKSQKTVDVSLVEKVKIISETILKVCMEMGQIDKARCCVVYEEAHSLTPEFNSVVVKDDNSHANGTAKVILQGRKYGLGCIIVTQRTANVTKSILNQCNTIFALRVFDDTGKTFLENYIGKDYSEALPTLEERHAIVMGKGIGLKQPINIELNDMKYLIEKEEDETEKLF
ncbi:MAG: DUF87 domain-containing protein [Eubacterium sp.]|nr:DUF87 domain-containing protein [Eubacterium sp.]